MLVREFVRRKYMRVQGILNEGFYARLKNLKPSFCSLFLLHCYSHTQACMHQLHMINYLESITSFWQFVIDQSFCQLMLTVVCFSG